MLNKKIKKLSIALLTFSILSTINCTTTNAVTTCCSNMRLTSREYTKIADHFNCYKHRECTIVVQNVYKNTYCKNCKADHGDTFLRSTTEHTNG